MSDKSWLVMNLSQHTLTDIQHTELDCGFNFAEPKNNPRDERAAGVALRQCKDVQKAEHARAAIASILRTAKPPVQNTSSEERRALRDLTRNEEITILSADKGNATVIMDTTEYKRKANELLDMPSFKKLNRNPTRRNERRVNDGLKRLMKKKNAINKDT